MPDNGTAGVGHNSDKGIAAARLKSFIERVERLEVDKANILSDVKEVYAEAEATGYDPKIMRKLIKLRKMDAADRQEEEALLQTYVEAVGF